MVSSYLIGGNQNILTSFLCRPIVFEHISALLSSPQHYSILLIERAVVCLLRLVQLLAPHVSEVDPSLAHMLTDVLQPSLRDQVYLAFDLLAGLPANISSQVGEQVIAGLILVIQKNQQIIRSVRIIKLAPAIDRFLGHKLSGI